MRATICTLILCFLLLPLSAQQSDIYDEKVTSAGNIGATISNLGLIGNAFGGSFNILVTPLLNSRLARGGACFPGGFWIGGLKNGQVAVSTGAVDDPSGYSTGKSGFEFTSKTPLEEKSSLLIVHFLPLMPFLTRFYLHLLRFCH